MRVIYDAQTDTLTIILSEASVAESDEDKPGIILDYDIDGNMVSTELIEDHDPPAAIWRQMERIHASQPGRPAAPLSGSRALLVC